MKIVARSYHSQRGRQVVNFCTKLLIIAGGTYHSWDEGGAYLRGSYQ